MSMFDEMKELTKKLVAVPSMNGTSGERDIADAIEAYLREIPYFKAHPELVITQDLKDDPLHRRNVMALLKGGDGTERDTIMLIIRVYMFRANERSTFVPFLHPVVETFRDIRTDTNQCLDSRTLWHCLINLLYHVIIAAADDSLHACCIVAVNDVVLGKHVGGRDVKAPPHRPVPAARWKGRPPRWPAE